MFAVSIALQSHLYVIRFENFVHCGGQPIHFSPQAIHQTRKKTLTNHYGVVCKVSLDQLKAKSCSTLK